MFLSSDGRVAYKSVVEAVSRHHWCRSSFWSVKPGSPQNMFRAETLVQKEGSNACVAGEPSFTQAEIEISGWQKDQMKVWRHAGATALSGAASVVLDDFCSLARVVQICQLSGGKELEIGEPKLMKHNVSFKWFWKNSSPIKSSTYCLLMLIKKISWRFGQGFGFLKLSNWCIVWDKKQTEAELGNARMRWCWWFSWNEV